MMKYRDIFDSKLSTSKLSLLYFTHCDNVKEDDKEAFETAFTESYNKAEAREMAEAQKGIFS